MLLRPSSTSKIAIDDVARPGAPTWSVVPNHHTISGHHRKLVRQIQRRTRFEHPASVKLVKASAHVGLSDIEQTEQHSSPRNTSHTKHIWVQTTSKDVFTAAVEAGVQYFVFPSNSTGEHLMKDWSRIASIPRPLVCHEGDPAELGLGTVICPAEMPDHLGSQSPPEADEINARLVSIRDRDTLEAAVDLALAEEWPILIMDAYNWQSIPAENLVAVLQGSPTMLMSTAATADSAVVALQALQGGVAGVLLITEDPLQVKQLTAWLLANNQQGLQQNYYVATVTTLRQAGMGHRVAVDLCEAMVPGEGMLVGSFARGLFLVHSECEESIYISPRPFRVNAGAVHAYTMCPKGKMAYLSELYTGANVCIADAAGNIRSAVVGRCKVETRPLMLMEATCKDGSTFSTLLQNAETVRLVGPSTTGDQAWQATSVSQLREGSSQVYISRGSAARHTGIAIEETIIER